MQGSNHAPVGWHRGGQRQPNWERPRPQERRHHNSVPYTPPHKHGTRGSRDKTYMDHNRESQGRRIPTINQRSQGYQTDANPYSSETPEGTTTATRGHQVHRQRQPGTHNVRNSNPTPSHGNETSVSSDSTRGQRQSPTFQQVRSAICRVEQYLAIPDRSGRESPQLEFFITQVVKDLYQQVPHPHSGDSSSIESDSKQPPHSSTPIASPYDTRGGQQSTLTSMFGRQPVGPTPPHTATSAWDQTHRAYFYSQGTTRQTCLHQKRSIRGCTEFWCKN